MSKYTTELRFIVESGFPLFAFDYPFYDEAKKEEFQSRFIKHFFFHEIGQETAEQFKHFLEVKFNEVLPYYNEMFRTAQIEYDPLKTIEFYEEHTRITEGQTSASGTGTQTATDNENVTREVSANGETSTTATDESESATEKTETTNDSETGTDNMNKAVSDTPQGRVSIDTVNGDYVSNLEQGSVSTEKTKTRNGTETGKTTNSGTNTQTGTSSTNSTETETRTNAANATTENTQTGSSTGRETYQKKSHGDLGVRPASYLLDEHLKLQRKVRTIELQFFEECNDLFMEIW